MFRKRRILSLVLSFSKSLDRKKGTARKGVLPRKTRAVASRKTRKGYRMGGGVGGEGVEPPRKSNVESSNPVLFLFFFLWEKRFDESLNFLYLFFLLIYSFSLSLSLDIKSLCLSTKFCFVWTRRRRRRGEKMVRFCFCFARERWSKIGRTLSRGAIRVAFRWTRKDVLYRRRQNSGFFSFL